MAEAHRGTGVAECWLATVQAHAQRQGVAKLRLSTAVDNHRAQHVYERAGWQRDDAFCTYELPLKERLPVALAVVPNPLRSDGDLL